MVCSAAIEECDSLFILSSKILELFLTCYVNLRNIFGLAMYSGMNPMMNLKTHIYLVPGLAAGKEIFRNLDFPSDLFEIHVLEWLIPEKNEIIANYAARMATRITERNAVLIGVSFGGVVVQEMAAFVDLKKLIIISSVKSKNELPKRLRIVRMLKLYRIVPTGLILSAQDLTNYAVGPRSKKRLALYNEYLHVRDKTYLNWAIYNMINWRRVNPDPEVVHIHGDADIVLPVKNIDKYICLKGGTHIMVLNKGKWLSEKITKIIQNN